MKRFMTILVLAMLVMAPAAMAANTYGWTLSNSPASSLATTGPFAPGLLTLYLWLHCVGMDGVAAAEFDLQSVNPANILLAFTALNGFLNAGGATNLLLATPCTAGPVFAGTVLILSNAPGEYCLKNSAANNKNVSVDCTNFLEWVNDIEGFSNTGAPAGCRATLCPIISVEESSWGEIKGLYR